MNRYFKLYRESMKRLHKLETIAEEVEPRIVFEPGLYLEPSWKNVWYASKDSDWDQWVDIDVSDEPLTPPPEFKVTMARQ